MITREDLYELVWSTPMIKVAEKFDVSGSYLARVCTALRVPRPERGYWAKLAVGKAPERPALPEPQPGDPIVWSRTDEFPTPTVPKPRPASRPRVPRLAQPVTGTHGLVRGAKEHFLASRKVDEGEHLKPYKKLLVDVTASCSGLDKALGFANDLFNALESAGHRVVVAPPDAQLRRERVFEKEDAPQREESKRDPYGYDRLWSPYRPTVVYVDSLSFGLAIVEMSESVVMRYVNGKYVRESEYVPPKASRRYVDHTWTTKRDLPTGRLRLVVYSPYRSVSWSTWFQETKTRTLTQDIRHIVKSIEDDAATLFEKLQEAEQQAEIRRQEWLAEEERRRQEDDRRREAQSIKDSRDQLEQVIQAWAEVVNLEQFFLGVEDRAQTLPEAERQDVVDRLRLAREFVGTQNPLDFFRGWKTPLERYVPLSKRDHRSEAVVDEDNDQDEEENTGIRDFQQDLRACTEGALTGSADEQYSEAKFLQVKAIIDRFRGREGLSDGDRRWTAKVTDVRNGFLFSASERWRADDSEHEHYSDSGGKSGGQKEKLAYTVLAASLAYQFGLEWGAVRSRSFRFVVIDEAFGRGSDESAQYGLRLFHQLNLQLLIVTPLQKIHIIEPFVSSVGFVHNEGGRDSRLRCLSIEEYRAHKASGTAEGMAAAGAAEVDAAP